MSESQPPINPVEHPTPDAPVLTLDDALRNMAEGQARRDSELEAFRAKQTAETDAHKQGIESGVWGEAYGSELHKMGSVVTRLAAEGGDNGLFSVFTDRAKEAADQAVIDHRAAVHGKIVGDSLPTMSDRAFHAAMDSSLENGPSSDFVWGDKVTPMSELNGTPVTEPEAPETPETPSNHPDNHANATNLKPFFDGANQGRHRASAEQPEAPTPDAPETPEPEAPEAQQDAAETLEFPKIVIDPEQPEEKQKEVLTPYIFQNSRTLDKQTVRLAELLVLRNKGMLNGKHKTEYDKLTEAMYESDKEQNGGKHGSVVLNRGDSEHRKYYRSYTDSRAAELLTRFAADGELARATNGAAALTPEGAELIKLLYEQRTDPAKANALSEKGGAWMFKKLVGRGDGKSSLERRIETLQNKLNQTTINRNWGLNKAGELAPNEKATIGMGDFITGTFGKAIPAKLEKKKKDDDASEIKEEDVETEVSRLTRVRANATGKTHEEVTAANEAAAAPAEASPERGYSLIPPRVEQVREPRFRRARELGGRAVTAMLDRAAARQAEILALNGTAPEAPDAENEQETAERPRRFGFRRPQRQSRPTIDERMARVPLDGRPAPKPIDVR